MKIADLKPGMLIANVGLITKADATNDSKFWKAPNLSYFPISNPYHGVVGRLAGDDEEFVELFAESEVGYLNVLLEMKKHCEERRADVAKDIGILDGYMKQEDT